MDERYILEGGVPVSDLNPTSDYSANWNEYRQLQRRFFLIWLGYVPGVGAFAIIVNFLFHTFVPAFIFAVAWMLWFISAAAEWAQFPCPRCGKTFSHREGIFNPHWGPFAWKCMNCGLKKYANSDFDI
jgi:predicted RNA-binding Zn-ribbon protein involved in translation (DUF1610 family)